MPRVLITRPQPGASHTAEVLARKGFEPVVLPLTGIVPLPLTDLPPLEAFQAVAITSANAVRHAPPRLLARIAHLPAHAVGTRTGEAALEAGLRVVYRDAGDAEKLARNITHSLAPGASVLILCGRVRRGTLEHGLAQAGLVARVVETYDTIAKSPSERELAAALEDMPVDAVLLYSATAAAVFAELAAGPLVGDAALLAISERVAEILPEGVRMRARIAPEPSEEALLSLLPV